MVVCALFLALSVPMSASRRACAAAGCVRLIPGRASAAGASAGRLVAAVSPAIGMPVMPPSPPTAVLVVSAGGRQSLCQRVGSGHVELSLRWGRSTVNVSSAGRNEVGGSAVSCGVCRGRQSLCQRGGGGHYRVSLRWGHGAMNASSAGRSEVGGSADSAGVLCWGQLVSSAGR